MLVYIMAWHRGGDKPLPEPVLTMTCSLRHQMKTFPCYRPFVWGIHRSPVNPPHKGQWRGALIFSLICAWTKACCVEIWQVMLCVLIVIIFFMSLQPIWTSVVIVRRAGLLWSQQDFEWRWSVPLFKCLTVIEFSFILFDLCLLITFFNFIMNYVPIVTFWIFTYHKIWILSIMSCFIWSYWIIYFLACLEVSWRVVS